VEQGPKTLLAAVIRGIPPQELRTILQEILENIENPEEETTEKSRLQMQLVEIYSYLTTIGQTTQYQARLPYLFWIN
jgi:hypothetical protein